MDVVAACEARRSDRNDCEDGRHDGALAAGRDEVGRTGVMDIFVAGVTVRVDASVDEAGLRRVLAALRRR